jgi:hypothetical protein
MTVDLGKQQQIEGLTVFGDDNRGNVFYVLADQPRFRVDDQTKKPAFKFIKYKDKTSGGGFVISDCVFVVPDDKLKKIQDALDTQVQKLGLKDAHGQPMKAEIDRIPFTDATASLTLLDATQAAGGTLVSRIESPAKPSLFGSMICPFTAELSPEGATVVEAAMKGSGGVMQISYDLHFPATFPPITGRVWFDASKFYSFYQKVDKSSNWAGGNKTETDQMHEAFTSSSAGGTIFDFESLGYLDADTRKKVQDDITNWGNSQIEEAAKAVLPDIKAADDRGDHGMDHITKNQTTWESASFNRYINEREGISFETNQGGTMPNLVDMGFKWEDFAIEIDANDPFFATIAATVAVNADFQKFGINSVDVHCEYAKLNPATIKDYHFTKPDDLLTFDSDTANGDMHWAYSFAVNYKDQAQAYQAPLVTTDKGHVTVNANDLGILAVDLAIGNVDFTKTPQVQVAITYPETDANGQPISQQFNFDKDKKSDQMLAVLLKPVDKAYQYQTTYIMTDGTQMVADAVQSQSSTMFINSPFTMHTYSFLAEGDFATGIDNIFLKLQYADDANKLAQEADYTFSSGKTQYDWLIPVVAHSKGQITYSGVITYKNHTTENISPTTATADLIEFGPADQLIISVTPDTTMLDFTQVKLVKLELEYADPAHDIDVKHEFVLKEGANPPPWTFYARDPKLTSYTWSATFYMGTPPKVVQVPPSTSSDSDLVLMMPS